MSRLPDGPPDNPTGRDNLDRAMTPIFLGCAILALLVGAGLVVLAGKLFSQQPAPACGPHCGSERWSVKVLVDADTGEIVPTLVPTTVAALRMLHAPPRDSLPANGRYGTVERTLYGVRAALIGMKLEPGDSDLHLVIADPLNHHLTMIAEVPNPHCALACSSPHAGEYASARAVLVAHLGKPGRYRRFRPTPLVDLVGVGFWDFAHHQTGLSPNAIELHPLIGVTFP